MAPLINDLYEFAFEDILDTGTKSRLVVTSVKIWLVVTSVK